jgi:hypothetical protein
MPEAPRSSRLESAKACAARVAHQALRRPMPGGASRRIRGQRLLAQAALVKGPRALAEDKNAVEVEEPVIDKKAVKARPPGGRCAPAARRARAAPRASSVSCGARARRSGAATRRALGAASNRQTLGTRLSGQPRARAARLSPPFLPQRASAHLWARGAQPQQRLQALRAPHSQRPR